MEIRNKSMFLVILAFSACIQLKAQTEIDILGLWQNPEDDKFQIEIYQVEDHTYYGKILNHKTDPSKEGKVILKKFTYQPDEKQFTGTMTPPEAKLELNAEIQMLSADKLKLSGHKFLMTKTIYLSKI